MIIDQLSSPSQYASIHPRFPAAFAFLQELLEKNSPDGRYVMPGADLPEAVFVNLSANDMRTDETATAESHQAYIDVQVVLTGAEAMYIPAETPAVTTPYQVDRDCALYAPVPLDACHRLLVRAGSFAIFFAGELHAPCHTADGNPARVRKAVLKILA